MAAFLEQELRMGRLEIIDADLGARNVRRYRENRRSAAVAIEESVDQMQISRSAAPGAYCQFAGQLSLRARRESRRLLVPNRHPFDLPPLTECIGESIKRIADGAVDAVYAGLFQRRSDEMCSRLGHGTLPVECFICSAPGARYVL